MVQEIAANLKASEPHRAVDFRISPTTAVLGDAALLRIALNNLIGNAWKFTGNHASATIEFGETMRDGKLTYFVRDDGAGFSMTYVDKLFKPFERLHKSSDFSGTGVGLATIQRVIERHGGKISAVGEVEKGATFFFSIPDRN